jgi:virginiamycin B lyase
MIGRMLLLILMWPLGTMFAQSVSLFPVPNAGFLIAAGPDGNLWYTEGAVSRIARITPSGAVTEFPTITAASTPEGIVAGPDGNLWFTEFDGNKIGRITTAGVVTEFNLITPNSGPIGITVGSDGALWFGERQVQKLGRITTAGTITEFATGTLSPVFVASGSDGALLWFTETNAGKIGRTTTGGVVSEFGLSNAGSQPFGIAAGPDGNIWFVELNANNVGRVSVPSSPSAQGAPVLSLGGLAVLAMLLAGVGGRWLHRLGEPASIHDE